MVVTMSFESPRRFHGTNTNGRASDGKPAKSDGMILARIV